MQHWYFHQWKSTLCSIQILIIDIHFFFPFHKQGEMGEDLVKLKYTTASAVKEKEGKVLCQGEVLCDGKLMIMGKFNSTMCVCTCIDLSAALTSMRFCFITKAFK